MPTLDVYVYQKGNIPSWANHIIFLSQHNFPWITEQPRIIELDLHRLC